MNSAIVAAARRLEARAEAVAQMPKFLKVGLIGGLIVFAFIVVRWGGGSPHPLNHLGYAPILLAAYLYGWRGGIVTGAAAAIILGPLPSLIGFPGTESVDATVTRGAFFVLVGALTGLLFDQGRAAMNGWRSAAVTIAQREREAMIALARGAEANDMGTGDHVGRVQLLTRDLALRVGMDEARASDVGWAAMLHDVGKLHVPDGILLKPGPLTAAEWKIMRQHALWGAEILAHGDGFELARRIARWHHENWDGSGYPDGLRGEKIPLEARLVRVVDAFDAMTHRRPYHEPRPVEWALEELERFAGLQFDPDLVPVFLALLGRRETSQAA